MDTRYPRREECINIKGEYSSADRESLGEKRRNKRNLNTHTDCIVSQKDRDQLRSFYMIGRMKIRKCNHISLIDYLLLLNMNGK